jgi:outer membrane protein TolC
MIFNKINITTFLRIVFTGIIMALSFINSSYLSQDSTVLSFDKFIKIVKEHHPLMVVANNKVREGIANQTLTRGAFDPTLYGNLDQKYFDDKQYYSTLYTGMKIPTWYGITLDAGYEMNRGVFLSSEKTVPDNGLWFAGISVPLGRGLVIDQRRTDLKQAAIYLESSQAERNNMVNELILRASNTYWDWFSSYYNYQIYQEAVTNASFRLQAIKQSAFLGDRPLIDTLEASIQLQDRQINLLEANMSLENSKVQLEIFLWSDGRIPYELNENTIPERKNEILIKNVNPELENQINTIVENHPVANIYQFKIEQTALTRKLKAENLKPEINLKYNPLAENQNNNTLSNYSINNYKWGASFYFPIFIRKERGDLQKYKIYEENAQMDFLNKLQELSYKVNVELINLENTSSQIDIYISNVSSYKKLLDSELVLFQNGESSLFMINSREIKYIESQVKWITSISKNQNADVKLKYALGTLYNDVE